MGFYQQWIVPALIDLSMRKLERAKLVVVAARERAAEMAQLSAAQPLTMRPTVLQRRRLAERNAAIAASRVGS